MTGPLVPEFKNWPSDPITSVEQKFLTKMPKDFMAFWEFCKSIDRENPREALLKSCGLLLVPSMSFYPDFPDFIQILSRFYPDFIQTLSRLYPDFILIFEKIWMKFR